MPKGSTNRHRSGGNGRTGRRDTPPGLREILQAYIDNPALLSGLPPPERAVRVQQLATFRATRAKRSAATRQANATRRVRETDRIVALLVDAETQEEMFAIWDTLTDHQRELVNEWGAQGE